MSGSTNITALLRAWQDGSPDALAALTASVYGELHRIARRTFRGERAGHTLQPTALVNEAFVKLVDAKVSWQDRAHFFALSARMMRRILLTHAEARSAAKRGGAEQPVTLVEGAVDTGVPDRRIEDLHEALEALAKFDPRKADLVELQVFGGLTFEEMAEVSGLSTSTLDRELRVAKAWLKQRLAD